MSKQYEKAFSTKTERSDILWSFRPEPDFPTISVTGGKCALNCDFCKGKYLQDMIHIDNPKDLYETCIDLESRGAKGVLLSGGYNEEGYVPFETYTNEISRVKEDTNLFLSIHSGRTPKKLVQELSDAGVDMVDFELTPYEPVPSPGAGKEKKNEDYLEILGLIDEEIPNVSPHILLGLESGELEAEKRTLKSLRRTNLTALVFLTIIPPDGNEEYESPEPGKVGEIVSEARKEFPKTPLALGCMRPRSEKRTLTEIQALKAGIDRIVLPSEKTKKAARDMGLELREIGSCCAVPKETLEKWYDGRSD